MTKPRGVILVTFSVELTVRRSTGERGQHVDAYRFDQDLIKFSRMNRDTIDQQRTGLENAGEPLIVRRLGMAQRLGH
jgi:hypothetical protein